MTHSKSSVFVPETSHFDRETVTLGTGSFYFNDHCFMAPHCRLEGFIKVDKGTNIQDGVTISHPIDQPLLDINHYLVEIGSHCSITHGATIVGPAKISKKCFVGFKALVQNSTLGVRCYVGHMAKVINVTLADRSYVPIGMVIDSQELADNLSKVNDDHLNFNKCVVDYNKSFIDIHKNPIPWLKSTIGKNVLIHEKAKIFGEVTISDNCSVDDNCSIRADEVWPFFIGKNTNIHSRCIFHGIANSKFSVNEEEYSIYVGDDCQISSNALIHGPTIIAKNTFVGKGVVVFGSKIGEGSVIRDGSGVFGVVLSPGSFVEAGRIIQTQEEADSLPRLNCHESLFWQELISKNIKS